MSGSRAVYSRIFAATPKTERGFPTVLSGDPKGKNFLYGFGNTVFIRSIEDPTQCDLYTEHAAQVNVARYAPSGFYIASGDESGKVRIWDTTQAEHILKNEFTPYGGSIKDLTWSSDNQRIVCCGDGKDSYASVFLSETGTTTGTIGGHSKAVNSCDFKPTRPFRIVTGSEDMTAVHHEGPPFKIKSSKHDHHNFVQCVRYSPNGEVFATASADKTIILYGGKDGEMKSQFKDGETAHSGSVYSICFSPDSRKLLSVSADKSAKIWDVASLELLRTFKFGTNVGDMQVGCLWQGDHILTLSLDGQLTYLDYDNVEVPKRVVRGHNKKITSLCFVAASTPGDPNHVMYSGDFVGNVFKWNAASGDCQRVEGGNMKAQVISMANRGGSTIASVSYDDMVRFIDQSSGTFVGEPLKCPSQPQKIVALKSSPDLAVIGCLKHIVVVNGYDIAHTMELNHGVVKLALASDGSKVACSCTDKKVRIYSMTSSLGLDSEKEIPFNADPTNLEFSPDGSFLAVIDSSRVIKVFEILASWLYFEP
ncbi:actin-interacting protein 1-like [Convolutriloba macropyga]|uniref:actin-interacting protein 1-like n=1 Tax=Convolutriloba macropyga TaxID=536237 RepID=UPI003F521B1E